MLNRAKLEQRAKQNAVSLSSQFLNLQKTRRNLAGEAAAKTQYP